MLYARIIIMQVFINIKKFEYWQQNLTIYFPNIVEEIEQTIWKGKNLHYLKQQFQYELVPNVTHDPKQITKEVHAQLLKVCLCVSHFGYEIIFEINYEMIISQNRINYNLKTQIQDGQDIIVQN